MTNPLNKRSCSFYAIQKESIIGAMDVNGIPYTTEDFFTNSNVPAFNLIIDSKDFDSAYSVCKQAESEWIKEKIKENPAFADFPWNEIVFSKSYP